MQYSAFIISLAIAASVNGFASNVDVDALAARNPTVAEANEALDNFAASVAARDARGGAFLKDVGQEAAKGGASALGGQAINAGVNWFEGLTQRDVDPVVEANEALRNLITRDVDPVVEANEALRNLIARDAKINFGGLAKSGASSGANFAGSQAVNWLAGEGEKLFGGDDQSAPPAGAQRRDAMPRTSSTHSSGGSTHSSPSTHTSENGGSSPGSSSPGSSSPGSSSPSKPSSPASAPSAPASKPSEPASAPSAPASKPSNAAPSSAGSPPAASSSSSGFGADILKEFGLGAANSAGSNGVTGVVDAIKGAFGGEETPTPTPSAAPARRDAFGAHGFRGAGPMGGIGGGRGGPRPQMGGIEAREARFSLKPKPSSGSSPSKPSTPSTPSSGAEPATSSSGGSGFLKDAGLEFLKGGALAGAQDIYHDLTGQATETPTPSAAPARR